MSEKKIFHFDYLLLTVLITFLLGGCQFGQKPKQAIQVRVNVSRVVSGQTLEVLGMGNQPTLISQVQLIGVEAPDLRQRPWGIRAKKRLQSLIGKEQPVTLEFDIAAQDKIGRTLAYVWKDGKLLNEQLVKEGYVLHIARSPNIKYNPRLERAQQWARLMGEQIWNPEKPMRLTPYQFRRQYR
ncbi:MAG: thermonuclease family protein [Calothrix sp. MO_167.B12]|nr:thermonuclease family protein [Calothrix sp. MO_167.B12]